MQSFYRSVILLLLVANSLSFVSCENAEVLSAVVTAEGDVKSLNSNEFIRDDLITALQAKLAETELQYKEAKTKLSDATRRMREFEVKNKECDEKEKVNDVNSSVVLVLQQEIQQLKSLLDVKSEHLENEVSNAQECGRQMKVCESRLISLDREKNEALQTQATTEKLIARMTESKDADVVKIASKLEDALRQTERQKEVLQRSQNDQRSVQRDLVELRAVLKTRQTEAKKHYCNTTMLREDFIAYSVSSWKGICRKLIPLVVAVKKNCMKFIAVARVQTGHAYMAYILPNLKKASPLARNLYQSYAQMHVDTHLRPLYDRHAASHVSKICVFIEDIQTGLYLLAISCVQDTSKGLLSVIERTPKDGEEYKTKCPDWLFNGLRFAAKNSEELVQATSKVLRWLFILWMGQIFLRLVLRLVCLPFRIVGLIPKKQLKTKKARKMEVKEPCITMV